MHEEWKIKSILGMFHTFLNYLIKFCFNVGLLGADRGSFPGSIALQTSMHGTRLAAPESRDSAKVGSAGTEPASIRAFAIVL
jgi:hypothetical protein